MYVYRDYNPRKAKAVRTLPGNQFPSVTVTVEFRNADWTSCFNVLRRILIIRQTGSTSECWF